MENIKNMSPMERPRERLQRNGAPSLTDEEVLAILLGSGTPQVPLGQLCTSLLEQYQLKDLAQMDLAALCRIKGIGPAKATVLLAAAEYSKRLKPCIYLTTEQACYEYIKPLLATATQLQYILLLKAADHQVLAFSEAGSVLPDITKMTALAIEAGALRLLLSRNGWSAFSNAESRYLVELRAVCAALNIICEGLMTVGPEKFKMI
jgi:hypothetical protein